MGRIWITVLASLIVVFTLDFPLIGSAQSGNVAKAEANAPSMASTLTVAGDVATPLSIAHAELKGLPRTRVEVKWDGQTIGYEGVLLGEILKRAGVPLGSELRGGALASYVVASATDGYQVVFSLAELDPAFTGNGVIVADTMDGKPLASEQGPLRIVVPKIRGRRAPSGWSNVWKSFGFGSKSHQA